MEMERQTRASQRPGNDLCRSPSDITIYYDFTGIAILTGWIRRQKIGLGYSENFFCVLFKMALCIGERAALITILVGVETSGIYDTRFWEMFSTLTLWLISAIVTILLKMYFQRNLNKEAVFCNNQVGGFWNAMLLIMKPCKYRRALLHRKYKLSVLGKEFIHGETVTMEQFEFILRVNREELVDVRDDLHDAFLQRIPMAILQFYYFAHSPCSPHIFDLANCMRILVVVLDLIATIQIAKAYEWKRHIYLDSLHVQGYLTTNGRYSVPTWSENCVAPALKLLSSSTAILSRFFLVGFAASVSFGHGIVCLVILFLSNWVIVVLFPSVLSTSENLPLGIHIRASYLVNRWINTFSGTTTRFIELSRARLKFFSYHKRFPLCITQVLSFGLAYFLLYCFVKLMAPVHVPSEVTESPAIFFTNITTDEYNVTYSTEDNTTFATDNITTTTEYTVSLSYCEYLATSKGTQYFSRIISTTAGILNIPYSNPSEQVFSFFHFHWVIFYLHIIITVVYNYYSSSYMRVENKEDFVPPVISLGLYKHIFEKIFQDRNAPNYITHLTRILFLMSLELKHFKALYSSYYRGDNSVNTAAWWDVKILDVVQKFDYGKTRYRDNTDPIPSLVSLPIEGEINDAYAAIQHLNYSFRLYVFCANRIDYILMNEMTSNRLEATIEMLELQRSEVLKDLEISIVNGN